MSNSNTQTAKSKPAVDKERRTWIAITCATGGAGAVALATPFAKSFTPSDRAKAAGASVKVDVSQLPAGEMLTAEWRGKPVWILHRTPEQLKALASVNENDLVDPKSEKAKNTPEYAKNATRSIKPELLVCIGICTHLGCNPTPKFESGAQPSLPNDWKGGFLCPCHGSTFDMAGRVFKNKPASDNLEVPKHFYEDQNTLVIGEDRT